jgi:rRNA maturation endonuclease Nob1
MVDELTTGASAPKPRCVWCSAELPSDHESACPSCGATLIGEGESLVPGVTAIDTQAIVRSTQASKTKSRSRLMSWLSGEYDESDKPAPPGSVSLPTPEVRREMLRLEIEAEVANLNAEVESIASEAAVESLIPIEILNAPYPGGASAASSDAVEAATDAAPATAVDARPAHAVPPPEDTPTS